MTQTNMNQDLISRAALLVEMEKLCTYSTHYDQGAMSPSHWECRSVRDVVKAAPSISPSPGPVTAEDVQEGIEWVDAYSNPNKVIVHQGGPNQCEIQFCESQRVTMMRHSVADILNGAIRRGEKITWPEGSRFHKKEPSLLEAIEQYLDGPVAWQDEDLVALRAAIERERGK